MSNRQARREQSRAARQARAARGRAPGRAVRRPPSRSNPVSGRFLLGLGAVLVVLALVGFFALRSGGGGDNALATAIRESPIPTELASGTKLGRDDAPIKLVSFEDFQCPFCLRYTSDDEPTIVAEYVQTGKVQYEYRHLPVLGEESVQAALASQCAADQDKFWQFHHGVYLLQAEAGQATNEVRNQGRLSNSRLKELAREAGIGDQARFDQCLDSAEHLAKVQSDQRLATQFGIRGTPGFTVNGQPVPDAGGPKEWRDLFNQLLDALSKGTPTPAATGTAGASPTAAPTATPTP